MAAGVDVRVDRAQAFDLAELAEALGLYQSAADLYGQLAATATTTTGWAYGMTRAAEMRARAMAEIQRSWEGS